MSNETALVLVLPEDGAEAIVAKLRGAGAQNVQLLVAEGAVALRRPDVAARLHELAIAAGIDLTLISSDPATLATARACHIQTLAVRDARVQAPGLSGRPAKPASPYSTRVLARPAPPPRAGASSDELDTAPPLDPAEAEELDALESITAALQAPEPPARRRSSDAEFLAASLSVAPGTGPRPAVPPRPTAPPPPTRPIAARPAPAPERAQPRRRALPLIALTIGLIGLLAVIAAVLLLTASVEVTVTAPRRPETVEPITALPVPIAPAGSGAAGTAVEAEALSSEIAVSEQGEVTEGTLTPSGTASGSVTILNSSPQALLLPAGTEFVAVRADGQEVPFVSNAEVLVPGATTADQGAQIVTTRGQAQVEVVARSPGSGSNVEANTIRRMTLPGGPTINTATGNLIVTNTPMTGGSETEVRIVKDGNVQALLAPALERLDAEGRAQLQALAEARGLTLDPTTVTPRRSDLEQLQGFEYRVEPPVGSTLDPANPRFTLTVEARYGGLAAPASQPIERQLGAAVTEQLRQGGLLQPGDCRAPTVSDWRWDGERLLVDGEIRPDTQSPGCQGGLDAAVLDRVREAVRGKPRAEAAAVLDALVAEGVIGSYTLPDAERLPRFDWQLRVAER
ncbi:MAG: baseplate J/gp47 family protein [Chloroflexi bacterium OHK40]